MVFASKEVILSAGAFVSPMILIRSGIGPRDQLDLLQVIKSRNSDACVRLLHDTGVTRLFLQKEPLVELPVGLNLQTHIVLGFSINVMDKSVFKYSPNRVTFRDFEEFKARGTGKLIIGCLKLYILKWVSSLAREKFSVVRVPGLSRGSSPSLFSLK